MHTGQNSIASENSLPQLGQVRLGSVLMALTALQPQSEPKATPRSIGPRRPLANYSRVFFYDLARERLQYLIRSRFKFHV